LPAVFPTPALKLAKGDLAGEWLARRPHRTMKNYPARGVMRETER